MLLSGFLTFMTKPYGAISRIGFIKNDEKHDTFLSLSARIATFALLKM
jgi:hypothetical protein